MGFKLEEQYVELMDEAREVAAAAEPLADEADALSEVHPGVRELLAGSRLWELLVPGAHGGRFEDVDPLAVCVVREVLMGTSSHLDSLFALQGIGSYAIAVAGTPEQQGEWLPSVATGEVLAALALTEPEAGSDLKSITTTVRAEDDTLVLEGAKAFISNAGAAGFYTTLAREGDGFSLLLVPADAAGLTISPTPELIAPHVLGDLVFEDVRLDPTAARLGEPGRGLGHVLATLAVFRVSVAGACIGLADAALREAARHAQEREQFGRPLARLGAVANMLADSWSELEAARLLTYRAATLAQADPAAALDHSSMAKLYASEAAGRIVDRSVQIMGRFGLVRGSKVERLYRQARPMRIYEGASDILRLGVSRALVNEVMGESQGGSSKPA
jgi:acyl-CoA dehydrogenase